MFLFKKNVRVIIKNQNLALEVKTGTNLYTALVEEGVIPPTLCRGNGQCGKCKVHITQKNMSRPNKKEQLVLARINLDAGFRLACQTVVKDAMVVDTSEITAHPVIDDFVVKPIFKEAEKMVAPAGEAELGAETQDTPAPVESVQTVQPPLEESKPTLDERLRKQARATQVRNEALDGVLLVKNKNQLRYFLYSAAIDNVSQEGTLDNADELTRHLEGGMLSDYVHNQLKLKDIDRMVIMSDEESRDGENLFDMISYKTFDIGATPVELLRPTPKAGDFRLFLRLLSAKGRNRLMISLDKLDYTYYIGENKVIQLPDIIGTMNTNLFNLMPQGDNPVEEISNDLRVLKSKKEYLAPDSLPLPVLMKACGLMMKNKIVDGDFNIQSRTKLDGVPLEYVVKVVQKNGENAFYLHRDKESSLLVTQPMLSALLDAKQYIHNAVKYTESYLGNIETIMVCTPVSVSGLLDSMSELELVPKRHDNIMVNNSGDPVVTAVKLFQESDVRAYVQNNYGTFSKSE